jgi:hypothetical protein
MGWHYILDFTCKILPEYSDFIEKKYLWLFSDSSSLYDSDNEDENTEIYKQLNKDKRDLIDIWVNLDIAQIHEYSFENGIFHCQISKKVTTYHGDLKEIYERFLKDIIVPISSEILKCSIESDDCMIFRYTYTDTQLRGKSFNLRDMIKTVEHTYNEDNTEIYESRIVYKRSIKAIQFLDLDRAYK